MQIKYPSQSPERMKVYREKWALNNKHKIIEAKRRRRLKARLKKLEGKKCLNCEILLKARLVDKGRSYLYCRKCISEHTLEVRRHKWRRYYYRKKGIVKEAPKYPSLNKYIPSWRTLKQHGNS
jgi:hypothetical protein